VQVFAHQVFAHQVSAHGPLAEMIPDFGEVCLALRAVYF
jgi:hypothetical protein